MYLQSGGIFLLFSSFLLNMAATHHMTWHNVLISTLKRMENKGHKNCKVRVHFTWRRAKCLFIPSTFSFSVVNIVTACMVVCHPHQQHILHKLKQGMDMKSIPVLILLLDFSVHWCCVPVKYSARVNHWYYCQVIISPPTNSQSYVSCWLEQQLLWARQLSLSIV